jgi:cytochrome b pre-mRNA-processing protein 3
MGDGVTRSRGFGKAEARFRRCGRDAWSGVARPVADPSRLEACLILSLFRPDPQRALIDGLHARVVEGSRRAALYRLGGVPDTVEGRFESLALHAVLLVRRLQALPAPADAVAQDFVDALFRHLDIALRELGVGDLSVGKRIKKLAKSFYGRVEAYGGALDAGDLAALTEALSRNVTLGAPGADWLARRVVADEAALALLDLEAILKDGPLFPAIADAEGPQNMEAPHG